MIELLKVRAALQRSLEYFQSSYQNSETQEIAKQIEEALEALRTFKF